MPGFLGDLSVRHSLGDQPDDLALAESIGSSTHDARSAGSPRMVHQDIEIVGYRVRAGTFDPVSLHALHRGPRLWETPSVFDPDRPGADRLSPERSPLIGSDHDARQDGRPKLSLVRRWICVIP